MFTFKNLNNKETMLNLKSPTTVTLYGIDEYNLALTSISQRAYHLYAYNQQYTPSCTVKPYVCAFVKQ